MPVPTKEEREKRESLSTDLFRHFQDYPIVDFKDINDVKARTNEFLDICEGHPVSPTIAHLALAYKCSSSYIIKLRNGVRSCPPEVEDYLNYIKSKIEADLTENVTGSKNPAGSIFLLKNHYDYKDVQEHVITPEIKTEASAEELESRAEMLIIEAEGEESPEHKELAGQVLTDPIDIDSTN